MPSPPRFDLMWSMYPREGHDALFDSIGWSDLKSNPNYANTCAIRMSLCLARCGVRLTHTSGGESILKGSSRGAKIETSQGKLSEKLAGLWGAPEKFTAADDSRLSGRKGVISFFGIPGYSVNGGLGGHIDLVNDGRYKFLGFIPLGSVSCAHACYFNAQTVWFWPAS